MCLNEKTGALLAIISTVTEWCGYGCVNLHRPLKYPKTKAIVYPWPVMCLFICINRVVVGKTIFAGATMNCERVL